MGAGLNRVPTYGGGILLDQINTSTPVVGATIASYQAAYGVIGQNDSGGQMTEAIGYSKWLFQLTQVGATAIVGSFSVAILGTLSPNAYLTFTGVSQGKSAYPSQVPQGPAPQPVWGYTNAAGFVPGIAPYEWQAIPGPSIQGSTGGVADPLILNSTGTSTPWLFSTVPLVAVRAVVLTVGSAGVCRLYGFAIP